MCYNMFKRPKKKTIMIVPIYIMDINCINLLYPSNNPSIVFHFVTVKIYNANKITTIHSVIFRFLILDNILCYDKKLKTTKP